MKLTLPTDSTARKEIPLMRGCLRYFPAALVGVARISKQGNDKHNPNEELHHARGKSKDHGDCIIRHLMDLQDMLSQGAEPETLLAEADALAWRALALSQELHEQHGAPLAPGARLPLAEQLPELPNPLVLPEPQYRTLAEGEILRHGDEFEDMVRPGQWLQTKCVGQPAAHGDVYRRKLCFDL